LAEHAAGEPFTRFLFELEHRTPAVTIDLREIAAAEAARQVEEHVLDLAIVLEAVDATGLLRPQDWGEQLCPIAPLGHPLAEPESVSPRELAAEHFVMAHPSPYPGYVSQIETLLSRYDVRPAKRATVKHQNTIVSFASAGCGRRFFPSLLPMA